MSRRHGPSLSERGLAGARPVPQEPQPPDLRPRPVLNRHCWVTGLPAHPGRWAGLLAEWRQDREAGGWQGRVVYAVQEQDRTTVLVESWVPASHLHPAG